MLTKRVISGLLFLPVFYLVTWKLDPVYFAALVLVAAVLGQQELYRMAKERGVVPNEALGVLLGALVVRQPLPSGAAWLERQFALFAAVALLILTARLFSPRPGGGRAGGYFRYAPGRSLRGTALQFSGRRAAGRLTANSGWFSCSS